MTWSSLGQGSTARRALLEAERLKEQELRIDEIIAELEAERDRLSEVIAVLAPTKTLGGRKGRRLSAAARKRISEGMRRNWAARKEPATG